MPKPKSLGQVFRRLREEAGLTRFALAKAARLDPAVLTRIETDERPNMRFSTVCQIAGALGVSMDDIAARAGLLRRKGVVRGRPEAQGARLLSDVEAVGKLLERASTKVRDLETTIKPK